MKLKNILNFKIIVFTFFIFVFLTQTSQAFEFNQNLKLGNNNQDVKELQRFLNGNNFIVSTNGPGSLGRETTKFGLATKNALIKFQKTNNISPAVGYFGTITREVVNKYSVGLNSRQFVNSSLNEQKNFYENGYYAVGGSITGIVSPVVLKNNDQDDLKINLGDKSNFVFPKKFLNGTKYEVTVVSDSASQGCYIKNGSGVISLADVKNVEVACGNNLKHNPFTNVFVGRGGVGSFNLSYAAGANGSITGTTSQKINKNNSGTSVTAVADAGYHFVNWSDGVTTKTRTDSNVSANIAVTANFTLNSTQTTPTFSVAAGAISFPTSVTISSAGADKIYYTTDGTDPTTASTDQDVTPLVISSATTIKALAIKEDYNNSAIGSVSYTQAIATAPSAINLAVGSSNPVGGVTNVAIPVAGATDSTGAVTGWSASTAETIKFTVTDSGSAVSTINIEGGAYTSGSNFTVTSTDSITIVVSTAETGKTTATRTFTLSVSAPAYASAYPPAQNGTYVKTTSIFLDTVSNGYLATDPTKTLTGNGGSNAWYTPNGSTTNQRFHIDLGSAKIVTRIYYENLHSAGAITNWGAKDFILQGSNTAGSFEDVTYANDAGWTNLTTSASAFLEHVAIDQADPKYITVTNTTAYRYYAFKFINNYGGTRMGVRRIELQTN